MKLSRLFQMLLLVVMFAITDPAHARVSGIVFGGDPDYPPFEWLQDGRPTGFHVELGQAMAAATGTPVRHHLQPWPDTVEALKSGRVDAVPMFRSEERERHFWFSQPLYFAHHAIYTVSDPGGVRRLQDLETWRIAVEGSSFAHDQFRTSGHAAGLVLVGTTREAVEALVQGRAPYAVLATGPADHMVRQLGGRVQRVGTPIWPREYSIAVRKDRVEVAEWVQQALAGVIANGSFHRLDSKWREEWAGRSPDQNSHFAYWLILAAVLIGSGLAAAWLFDRRGRSALSRERRKRAQAERNAEFVTRHDVVTGLPNLASFAEQISVLTSDATVAEPVEFVVLKASSLGAIAEADGPDVADQVMRHVANCFDAAGITAASLGRGTFAAALQLSHSLSFAALIKDAAERAPCSTKPEFVWGAARCPEHGSNVDELIRKAEVAVHACMSRHRQWLVYEAALEPGQSDLQLIKDFESFGKEQIFAVYQPQLDLSSGRILSAEVLARWDHPDRGAIAPKTFVPLLESAGLISHVTLKMLDAAVRQSVSFRNQGIGCRFSVNLSVHDLRGSDVPALVADLLEQHGGRPEDLLVELTESSAIEDPQRVRGALQRLKNMGVATAIDDFGTGFSSLANLIDLPFDELKIDRAFIHKMIASPNHRSVVKSIIDMGHEIEMTVVAEGAEDQGTLVALANKGCDRIQGYAISKPLSASDLLRFCAGYENSESLGTITASGAETKHVIAGRFR